MPQHQHFIIHKPYGYLSQFVNNQTLRKNKKLLGELYDFPEATMAIGRLDEDSEGLLLLTTDGRVSFDVRDKIIEKEYYAMVDGIISDEAIEKIENGIEINVKGKIYQTKPCKAHKLNESDISWINSRFVRDERHGPTSWLSITLTEGKFRQVRKMTAAVGFPTLRLIRVRIGEIQLGKLPVGAVREKTELMKELMVG